MHIIANPLLNEIATSAAERLKMRDMNQKTFTRRSDADGLNVV